MQDFDALRARVEETARRMKETQTRRSEGNQSLVAILAQLESKFSAQQDELDFYMGRIGPLEHTNAQLAELIEKLLGMVDSGFGDDSLEPLRRASTMASTILDEEMAAPGPVEAAVDAMGQFEDVGPETLATDAGTSDEDLDALPEFVRRGLAEHQAEAEVDAIAQTDQPEVAVTEAKEPAVTEAEEPAVTEAEEPAAAEADAPEIEMIAATDEDNDAGEEIAAVAEIETAAPPVADPPPAETIETVEALASALDQKNAIGEPLKAEDIKELLDRVEALAHETGGDDLDIPLTDDEEHDIALFDRDAKTDKTGTEG